MSRPPPEESGDRDICLVMVGGNPRLFGSGTFKLGCKCLLVVPSLLQVEL